MQAVDLNERQLALFQTFLCNTEEERQKLSNTIELWDSVPRYCVTRRQQNMMRDEGTGHLPIFTKKFYFKGETFVAEIRPALLNEEGPDGNAKSIAYYPSGREELVEDALRKIASRKANGFFQNTPEMASGVSFTLYELQCELARLGHTLSHKEITQALNIMRFSNIDIYLENGDKKARVSSSYIPVLMSVSKKQYDSDPDSKWVVHFHPFVTQGIMSVAYRQFNYELMMSLSTQLGRWLHKYLCIKFTGAGLAAPPFEIHYNTIKRDSGLLNAKQERNNYVSVSEALDEIKSNGVLSDWKKKEIIGPRGKYLDIIYYLTPTMAFIKEVKAANKRNSDSKDVIHKATADKRLSK
ncbi:hypothetical protein MTYM_00352 [Methylococcales bacterium]|nr:hypothetical protein MTYM_00352 [Methylococcales bacterium]